MDPADGYHDPRDPFATAARSAGLPIPCASHATMSGASGQLSGIRLDVVREPTLNAGAIFRSIARLIMRQDIASEKRVDLKLEIT